MLFIAAAALERLDRQWYEIVEDRLFRTEVFRRFLVFSYFEWSLTGIQLVRVFGQMLNYLQLNVASSLRKQLFFYWLLLTSRWTVQCE